MDKDTSSRIALATLLSGIDYAGVESRVSRKPKEEKPCLNCGKPKVHNNAFCSARCCAEYRERKKT